MKACYPSLLVDLRKIRMNAFTVANLCNKYGIDITGVTKGVCGSVEIAQAFVDAGISMLGDSQLENLRRLKGISGQRWMLRIPSLYEVENLVENAEVSLHSEIKTLREVQKVAKKYGVIHNVILMMELGDLREGIINENEFLETAEFVQNQDSIKLYGIGTNLGCLNFIQPDTNKMQYLLDLKNSINPEIRWISAGNSTTLSIMMKGGLPKGINNLRLGEALLLGRERSEYKYIEGTTNDAFILEVELVECKLKPSLAYGKVGVNSYGQEPALNDFGIKKRGICAVGHQIIDEQTLWPLDEGIKVIGASSDHLVLDLSDGEKDYKVGDIIQFRLGYFSILRVFNSNYVNIVYRQ